MKSSQPGSRPADRAAKRAMTGPHPLPPLPIRFTTKSIDRCYSPGVVRCAREFAANIAGLAARRSSYLSAPIAEHRLTATFFIDY